MRKTITITAATLLIIFSLQTVAAQTAKDSIRQGANTAAGQQNSTQVDASNLIASIINILSVVVGAVAVIMLIWGGFRYVTSAGNDSGVQAAKNTIIYAIVGLVVVALAQLIVYFVLGNLTNTTASSTSSGSTAGSCKTTPYGRYWVGGPKDGQRC